MNHEKYKEWLILEYYGELGEEYKTELELHLHICEECQKEKISILNLLEKIPETGFFHTSEEVISGMRRSFSNRRQILRSEHTIFQKTTEFIRNYIIPQPKYAFSLGAVLLIGILTGYFFFSPKPNYSKNFQNINFIDASNQISEPQINNLKFLSKDANNGEVEISFDEVRNVQFKGSINDEKIQKALVYSLLNEENPGTRLKTVDAIAKDETKPIDNIMKETLIKTLKTDENMGVRKEAMRVLHKIPLDDSIKEAFLFVLNNDKNSGMRILAINSLGEAKDLEKLKDMNTRNILKYKMENDENDYIRMRAKTILMETK